MTKSLVIQAGNLRPVAVKPALPVESGVETYNFKASLEQGRTEQASNVTVAHDLP